MSLSLERGGLLEPSPSWLWGQHLTVRHAVCPWLRCGLRHRQKAKAVGKHLLPASTSRPSAVGPAGVLEHGIGTEGPPGTWEPLPPPSSPEGGTAEQGDEPSEVRMGGRVSEQLIVPTKRGKPPERPRGGKELSGHGTVGWKDDGETKP